MRIIIFCFVTLFFTKSVWSIENYLDFVLLLMVGTGLSFQIPILQLLLGILGLVKWKEMLSAWRWVLMLSAIAGAIITPSTDPITMLLLASSISILFLLLLWEEAEFPMPQNNHLCNLVLFFLKQKTPHLSNHFHF